MRKQIIYRIGDLCETNCDNCKKIPFARSSSKGIAWCGKNCDIGKELIKLGEQLLKNSNPRKEIDEVTVKKRISTKEVVRLKNEGKSQSQIADILEVTEATVYYHLNKAKNTHDESLVKTETTPNKALETAWKEEYAELEKANDTLQRKYEAAINENAELKEKYDRLYLDKQEIRDQFNKTCEDLEDEIASLKEQLKTEKNNHIAEIDEYEDNMIKLNASFRAQEGTLEALTSRYEREVERLNGINLEQEEKIQVYKMALKVSL